MGAAAPDPGSTALVLGVIVPCRDEAAVIARRLRNLAATRWPTAPRPHHLVVVDDGSVDGTAALADGLCAELFPASAGAVQARVTRNRDGPGKSGAIRTALGEVGRAVDLIVLTDADVVMRPDSLVALQIAFTRRPDLGLACGRQEFVRDLLDDGSCRGADAREPAPAAEPYDRWTARVRAWESRRGRVFSVHGQLLAWRASLSLSPTAGVAADDLDLMFQVRDLGLRRELVPGAAFLEVKPAAGAAREAWQRRRARAWFQVMQGRRLPPGARAFDRWQLRFYQAVHRLASPATHAAVGVALLTVGAGAGWLLGGDAAGALVGLLSGALLLAVLIVSPIGRGTRALVSQWPAVRAARAAGAASGDRWETRRGGGRPRASQGAAD